MYRSKSSAKRGQIRGVALAWSMFQAANPLRRTWITWPSILPIWRTGLRAIRLYQDMSSMRQIWNLWKRWSLHRHRHATTTCTMYSPMRPWEPWSPPVLRTFTHPLKLWESRATHACPNKTTPTMKWSILSPKGELLWAKVRHLSLRHADYRWRYRILSRQRLWQLMIRRHTRTLRA